MNATKRVETVVLELSEREAKLLRSLMNGLAVFMSGVRCHAIDIVGRDEMTDAEQQDIADFADGIHSALEVAK